MIKKIIRVLLVGCLIIGMNSVCFAQQDNFKVKANGKEYTFEEIAEMTHLDSQKLKKYYYENKQDFISQLQKLEKPKMMTYRSLQGLSVGKSVGNMDDLIDYASRGNIIISGTNTSKVKKIIKYRHGHAAIYVGSNKIVQAPGPGAKSEKVPYYKFGAMERVRLYEIPSINLSDEREAAKYATRNLVGIDYDIDAKRDDPKNVNCATLVWKAYYHSIGLKLGGYFYTSTPQALVEDSRLCQVAHLNWGGDPDCFGIPMS